MGSRNEYRIEGLNCANCAMKIESELSKLDGIRSVRIDFITKKMTIEAAEENAADIIARSFDIADEIEPGIKFIENKEEIGTDKENFKTNEGKSELYRIIIGAIIYIIPYLAGLNGIIRFIIYFLAYIIVGGEVLLKAIKNISRLRVFDENFLMGIATLGAFAIGEYPEAVAVMLFYQVGEYFQDMAVNKSRKSIAELMDIRPDYANLKVEDEVRRVSPHTVNVGDYIIVRPGEKIPLDGIITEGKTMVDTSSMTGESIPKEVYKGSEVLGGFINKNGLITVKVTKEFGESTVSKILELVQNASSKKAFAENFITKFAKYYTPVVVFMALGLATIPPLIVNLATFNQWIYRALVFLVISCPCALVVSIPMGFFGGIGSASKKGILIKGSNFLEALNSVDTVVFDKTGTLTQGVFEVIKIKPISISEEELLEYAALCESQSNHPIAVSILKKYGKEIDKTRISEYNEVEGVGISAKIDGNKVSIGNDKLMDREGIVFDRPDREGTIAHIAIGNEYAGYIEISDLIKQDSYNAIKLIGSKGIKRFAMLTGDNKVAAENVARILGISEFYSGLLPHEKVEKLETIRSNMEKVGKMIFVGDGINDAPVLARADIGIAMGGLGSDAAIEAADIVILNDELSKIADAIGVAKNTRNIVLQNIVFALGVKVLVLILGALGYATMWEAVFADVGVTIIAVLNSIRILRK